MKRGRLRLKGKHGDAAVSNTTSPQGMHHHHAHTSPNPSKVAEPGLDTHEGDTEVIRGERGGKSEKWTSAKGKKRRLRKGQSCFFTPNTFHRVHVEFVNVNTC